MDKTEASRNLYDQKYGTEEYYWGVRPSSTCIEVLKRLPPDRRLRLLDIGCGEGRDAVFFARNGYEVHAFDFSEAGVQKTMQLAQRAGVHVETFQADLNTLSLSDNFDIFFSTGVLHMAEPDRKEEIFQNYKEHTNDGGIHVLSVFVRKPFLDPTPDPDPNGHLWKSGELFTHYADWRIEWCTEEIFDCMSSGVPHQHAVNRIVARKPSAPAHQGDQ
jgi:tellurite methyltransferase